LLACYGVSIAFIVIPIRKYLNQDVATSVTILSANASRTIPFPALQVCNFNIGVNANSITAYFYDPKEQKSEPAELNISTVAMLQNDYDYDFNCYEINNVIPSKAIQISSKRQKLILVVNVPQPQGKLVNNTACYPDLCDDELAEDDLVRDIRPLNDAQGISLGAFPPDGKKRVEISDDVIYLNSGSYSQVSLSYSRTWRFENTTAEEGYSFRSTNVRYVPGAYAVNFTADGDSFKMDDVVFAEISFGELSFTEINETKPYEAFNAFGDATAILGFFTGFGFYGGPVFLNVIMDYSTNWASVFYN